MNDRSQKRRMKWNSVPGRQGGHRGHEVLWQKNLDFLSSGNEQLLETSKQEKAMTKAVIFIRFI